MATCAQLRGGNITTRNGATESFKYVPFAGPTPAPECPGGAPFISVTAPSSAPGGSEQLVRAPAALRLLSSHWEEARPRTTEHPAPSPPAGASHPPPRHATAETRELHFLNSLHQVAPHVSKVHTRGEKNRIHILFLYELIGNYFIGLQLSRRGIFLLH